MGRAPFLPDLHLRMYYHEAFHGADISHKMASKSISMRKFPTEPPGETLTNKLLTATATSANLGADLKTSTEVSKPKPCCVCKEEKATRDECMLFSNAKDPQKDCATTIDKYKSCMAGFGFNLP